MSRDHLVTANGVADPGTEPRYVQNKGKLGTAVAVKPQRVWVQDIYGSCGHMAHVLLNHRTHFFMDREHPGQDHIPSQ